MHTVTFTNPGIAMAASRAIMSAVGGQRISVDSNPTYTETTLTLTDAQFEYFNTAIKTSEPYCQFLKQE